MVLLGGGGCCCCLQPGHVTVAIQQRPVSETHCQVCGLRSANGCLGVQEGPKSVPFWVRIVKRHQIKQKVTKEPGGE